MGGEVRCCDDENGAEKRAGSRQALHIAEQAIEEAIAQCDKPLILRCPVGANFEGAHKAEGVFNLGYRFDGLRGRVGI